MSLGIIISLICASIAIRFLLEVIGQKWITTFAHTATLTILPIITFVITKVISGNIALSLGMVGALSIVRFRNPVRSPLELSVYFGAITMGITAAVSMKWLAFFLLSIVIASLLLLIASYLTHKILRRSFFKTSFSEGNSLSTLEISSLKNIDMIENNILLKSKSKSKESIKYLLVSNDFDILRKLIPLIEENEDMVAYQLNE